MPSKNKNPKIGLADCPDCPALVLWRVNVRGLAYAYCNGRDDLDGRACGMAHTMGKKTTEALKAIATTNAPEPAPEPEPEPETQAEPKSDDRPIERNPWSLPGYDE